MKIKSYLTALVPAAIAALMATGCSDYDNGYTEAKLKFIKDFQEAFGDIDPEQDWNLAERATVTVNVSTPSEIKIYALRGEEYCIVGDYENVSGSQVLGFDMLEGTESVLVSDGKTGQVVMPGSVVVFDATRSTRTVYGGNGTVQINKITQSNGVTIGSTTYPQYLEADADDYEAMKAVIPEIGYRKNYTNLNNVTHDFTYRSTGKFIIYPYYWETSSDNTIGIYYYDNSGNRQEVDIYTIKGGDELQYRPQQVTSTQSMSWANATTTGNSQIWKDWHAMVWTKGYDNLIKNLGLPNGNLLERFTDVTIQCTMKKQTPGIRLVFYKSDGTNKWVDIANPHPSDDGEETVTTSVNLQSLVNQDATWRDYLQNCSEVCIAGSQNESNGAFTAGNGTTGVYGDVIIDKVDFEWRSSGTSWQNYTQNFCSEIFTVYGSDMMRGQGIVIDIPEGTMFGMYLKKGDHNNPTHTFYSESSLNTPSVCGNGVTDDGQGNVTEVPGLRPCYASTFKVNALNGQMFLGFEDWPNDANMSDFDLNDVVFAFSGATPTVVNEDPEPAASWMLACEDLGGTFDTDYNDVVLKITHISGQTTATLTPLAAGGTLASYIFHVPKSGAETCFGEIHQLFGDGSEVSGSYKPINVGNSRGSEGRSVNFTVDKTWSMAAYSTDTWSSNSTTNMGGFEIRTLPIGTQAPTGTPTLGTIINSGASRIPAPDLGAAPYIICFPYSYVKMNTPSVGKKTEIVWAWPQEFIHITDCYPDFQYWVTDHKTNGEWYKNKRDYALTVSPLEFVSDIDEQNNNNNNTNNNNNNTQGTQESSFGTTATMTPVPRGSNSGYMWRDGDDHLNLYMVEDQVLEVSPYAYNTTGAITLKSFDAGGTGTSYTLSSNTDLNLGKVTITAHAYSQSGTVRMVLHYAGDATYKEKDITITINVASTNRVKLTTNGKSLVYSNDGTNDRLYLDPNNSQFWVFEQCPGDTGYYYLYNESLGKYLRLGTENTWSPIFTDAVPINDARGKFRLDSGKIQCKYNNGYLGSTGNDNGYVYLNKSSGDGIVWTLGYNAKQRNAKARK
ncbi:MAG: DUF4842 domain-containing protein [Bacteroidaceae bacterium]|nr:DUF4842 domain-containing protein [Bacteroidaceae bacterium]